MTLTLEDFKALADNKDKLTKATNDLTFEELDLLLEKCFPSIPILLYNKILRDLCHKENRITKGGGLFTYTVHTIKIESLYNFLKAYEHENY